MDENVWGKMDGGKRERGEKGMEGGEVRMLFIPGVLGRGNLA